MHGPDDYVDISEKNGSWGRPTPKGFVMRWTLGNFLLHSELPLIELKNKISYDVSQESCQN